MRLRVFHGVRLLQWSYHACDCELIVYQAVKLSVGTTQRSLNSSTSCMRLKGSKSPTPTFSVALRAVLRANSNDTRGRPRAQTVNRKNAGYDNIEACGRSTLANERLHSILRGGGETGSKNHENVGIPMPPLSSLRRFLEVFFSCLVHTFLADD